ncbi:hypothetical protein L596_016972 [Steinernema carpocapsae]|uniref:Uncharacterized protein n=1 Tax=Steinernema carpocapsae TaxID=34508 RepID=A0A4U5N0B6_STECR|nr:hypothetical protein L596_016972 [Steinernema carpocapsae]
MVLNLKKCPCSEHRQEINQTIKCEGAENLTVFQFEHGKSKLSAATVQLTKTLNNRQITHLPVKWHKKQNNDIRGARALLGLLESQVNHVNKLYSFVSPFSLPPLLKAIKNNTCIVYSHLHASITNTADLKLY